MRVFYLILLTMALTRPALAQLEPLNSPAAQAPAPGQSGTRPLTPDGKIQIGYDKRADYRLIKQPTGANPVAETKKQNTAGTVNRNQEAYRDLGDDDAYGRPQGLTVNPPNATAAPPTPAPAAVDTKPRSDSALRSDSSPAKEAAAAAQAANAAKAAEAQKNADALAAALAAAQKAGALPLKAQ